MMIAWTAVQDTIKSWVAGRSGVETSWANQRAPQPAYPYASLWLHPPRKVQGADLVQVSFNSTINGQEMVETVVGQREITVGVDVFTNLTTGEGTAMDYLERALAGLTLPSVIDRLRIDGGLSLVDFSAPVDLTGLEQGADFVSRAHADVRFYLVSTVEDRTGIVDTAVVTPTIDGTQEPDLILPVA